MGREWDDDSVRAWIRGRSSFLPLHVPEEHLKPHPGCKGRGAAQAGVLLWEAACITQLAPLPQLLLAQGSLDMAEGGSLHPGHGKSPAPASSPNCLGQKKLLGSSKQSTPASSLVPSILKKPRRNCFLLPPLRARPPTVQAGMVTQVHTQVLPQRTLLRDQQKPLEEQLACRNLYREAVCSERSCTPQRLNGGGRVDHAACRHHAAPLTRSPNPGTSRDASGVSRGV